ncbi:MAG: hypothetical protein CFE26_23920, partial [Verrucomicrobiales bacterium VVV1]
SMISTNADSSPALKRWMRMASWAASVAEVDGTVLSTGVADVAGADTDLVELSEWIMPNPYLAPCHGRLRSRKNMMDK